MSTLLLTALLLAPAPALAGQPWMGGARGEDPPVLAPDPRGAGGLDRRFDLQRLQLDLALLPDQGAVEGTATLSMLRLADGPVVLDQVALIVASVRADGQDLPWRTEGDTLIVDVPAEFGEGGPASLTVAYRAEPRTGLHFRHGDRRGPDGWSEVWSQGEGEDNRHWFPSFDHPGDRFAYEGHITAPDGWQVVTNSGVDLVNYLVMVAAGPWEVVTHDEDDSVEVWVPPGTDPVAVHRVLDPIPAMQRHFAERTGVPYPWGPYRQVFVQRFLYTGMENTSATIEHERMLVDAGGDGTSDWVESVAAHELAHQWYGDLLTCENWRELWLNEGFATFMAADWMAQVRGEAAAADQVRRWVRGLRDHKLPVAGRFFHGRGAADNHDVYGKGALVLHMLRVMLGEDRFWAGIARYTQGHQRGLVETIDLQRAMEQVSGQQLDWFFQQWIELDHVPQLTVTRRYAEGRLTVSVRQRVDDTHPPYTLPIDIAVGTADGRLIRRRAWLDDEEVDLDVALDEAPLWVAFDPDAGILAKVDDQQDDDAWVAQLAAPLPGARLDATVALGETDHSDALAALLADTGEDQAIRVAAARALGEQRATAALLTAVDDADPRVQLIVAKALRKSPDDTPLSALLRLARRDDNVDVRAAALRAAAALDPGPTLPVARSLLGLRDRTERPLRSAAIEVIGEHGVASDIAALLDERAPGRLWADGLSAAARIAGRGEGDAHERQARRVARAAEQRIRDLDLRTRQRVVGVLGQVGDEQTISVLESFRRWTTLSGEKEAAAAAVTAIRSRATPASGSDNEQAARIEALEERLDALETELERARDRH